MTSTNSCRSEVCTPGPRGLVAQAGTRCARSGSAGSTLDLLIAHPVAGTKPQVRAHMSTECQRIRGTSSGDKGRSRFLRPAQPARLSPENPVFTSGVRWVPLVCSLASTDTLPLFRTFRRSVGADGWAASLASALQRLSFALHGFSPARRRSRRPWVR